MSSLSFKSFQELLFKTLLFAQILQEMFKTSCQQNIYIILHVLGIHLTNYSHITNIIQVDITYVIHTDELLDLK